MLREEAAGVIPMTNSFTLNVTKATTQKQGTAGTQQGTPWVSAGRGGVKDVEWDKRRGRGRKSLSPVAPVNTAQTWEGSMLAEYEVTGIRPFN